MTESRVEPNYRVEVSDLDEKEFLEMEIERLREAFVWCIFGR